MLKFAVEYWRSLHFVNKHLIVRITYLQHGAINQLLERLSAILLLDISCLYAAHDKTLNAKRDCAIVLVRNIS